MELSHSGPNGALTDPPQQAVRETNTPQPGLVGRKVVDRLVTKIQLTYGARFAAVRRLQWHALWAQITVTGLSIALIALPVFDLAEVRSRYTPQVVSAAAIILAVFVLSFGLLLGQVNFGLRADAMSRSARAMLHLDREMQVLVNRSVTEQEYLYYARMYAQLIDQAGAHRPLDELAGRLGRPHVFYKRRTTLWRDTLRFWLGWALEFSLYVLVLALAVGLIASFI